MRILWAGVTRANTVASPSTASSSSSAHASRSAPVSTGAPFKIWSSSAIAAAVEGWSPVIMTTDTPAERKSATAAAAVGRTPSARPRKPNSSMSLTRSSASSARADAGRSATASTRSPRLARRSTSASSRSRVRRSMTVTPSGARQVVQRGNTISGAPLTDTREPLGLSPTTAWYPRAGSKASSLKSSQPPSPSLASTPAASAPSSTARSVAWGRSSPSSAGLARSAAASTSMDRGDRSPTGSSVEPSDTRCKAICPAVSVPVLSKHKTSTRPSASIVRGLRTSAPRSASRCAAAS